MPQEPRPLEPDEYIYVRLRVIHVAGHEECPSWCIATGETVGRSGRPDEESTLVDIRNRSHALTSDEIVAQFRGRR